MANPVKTVNKIEMPFALPVEFSTTKTGQVVANFPQGRLRIHGFAKTEAEAWAHLQRRLQEVIKGERNIL